MPRKKKTPPGLELTEELIAQGISDLLLDRPYYDARLVGTRIEFHTYGGEVLTWEIPGAEPPPRGRPKDVGAAPRGRPKDVGAAPRGRPKGGKKK
jgi:hypothetical protein